MSDTSNAFNLVKQPEPACFSHPLPVSDIERDSGLSPAFVSSYAGAETKRAEFIRGAEFLGLNTKAKPLHPQQYVIADALNATGEDGLPLHTINGVCVPRRASKTTTIFAVLLGRALSREGYLAGYSAQNGLKTRERFMRDIVAPLERLYPDESTRPYKLDRSKGAEAIKFPETGSALYFLPPKPESSRGDAYDDYVLDEAQEHDAELSEELLGAILPTFDTNPGASLVIAGTAGQWRSGLLWDTLEDGRNGVEGTGIVEYAASQDLTVEDFLTDGVKDWEKVLPEVRRAHPGIGTLTRVEAIKRNFDKLPLPQFLREYLGVWPKGATDAVLNQEKWADGALDEPKPAAPPKGAVLGVAAHPDQAFASIGAAWRDAEGKPVFLVVDHRPAVAWLGPRAVSLARKFRIPVAHDTAGAVGTEVEVLRKANPKPQLRPLKWSDVKLTHATFVKELGDTGVTHYGQPMLNEAVRIASKRTYGERGGWALGRAQVQDDITPLEACLNALAAYDAQPVKRKTEILVA